MKVRLPLATRCGGKTTVTRRQRDGSSLSAGERKGSWLVGLVRKVDATPQETLGVSGTWRWRARPCAFASRLSAPLSEETAHFVRQLPSRAEVSEVKAVQTPGSAQGGTYSRKAAAADRGAKRTTQL